MARTDPEIAGGRIGSEMASSVAKMPMEHSYWVKREAGGSFRRDLKGIVKDRACVAFCEDSRGVQHSPPCSPCSTCSDASSTTVENLDSSSACSRQRQSSRIVDRWVESLARGLFTTTVERKTHEAELSAISSIAEPVSSRTAAFNNRDGSPSSVSPTSGTSSARSLPDDLPSNVRASSLIQLWRELEAYSWQVQSPPSISISRGETFAPSIKRGSFSSEESFAISETNGGAKEGSKMPISEVEIHNLYPNNVEEKDELGWRKIESLLVKMRQERREELERLMQGHHVSKCSHKGWIQALLRFKHSNRLFGMAQQQFPDSSDIELDSLQQRGSTICFLSPRDHQPVNAVQIGKGIPVVSSRRPCNIDQETVAARGIKFTSAKEDHISEISNISCEKLNNPLNLNNQAEDLISENFEDNQKCPVYQQSHKSYPETTEIQELLLRRPVFTLISGDFRKTMDKLVQSLFRKQQSMSEDGTEEELLTAERKDFGLFDQVKSSLPVMPLSFECSDDNQESCITSQPSHLSLDRELLHDLKDDVTEIHHELAEMRKLLEHRVDEHSMLQGLIRDHVSSACFCSVGISLLLQASIRAPAKRVLCCVCDEMQIDAVLYRCGHMCACYKCSQELKRATGTCPVCSSPIDDAIRVHPRTNFSLVTKPQFYQ